MFFGLILYQNWAPSVQEQPFRHCASTALTVSVSGPLYGPRQPVCCLFASSMGRLYLFCVYLLLVSQRMLGRMNCEFIHGRGLKPVRIDTPPGCCLIVFFCHIKQIKVRHLRRRQSATSRAAHYDSSAQFLKRLFFIRNLGCHFFNYKVLQLCIFCARRCYHESSCEGPCKGRKIFRGRQGLRRSRGLPRMWEHENQCLSCSISCVRRRAGLC